MYLGLLEVSESKNNDLKNKRESETKDVKNNVKQNLSDWKKLDMQLNLKALVVKKRLIKIVKSATASAPGVDTKALIEELAALMSENQKYVHAQHVRLMREETEVLKRFSLTKQEKHEKKKAVEKNVVEKLSHQFNLAPGTKES